MTTTIRLVKAVSEAGDVVVCPPDGIAETVLELGGETTRTERDSLYALQAAVVAGRDTDALQRLTGLTVKACEPPPWADGAPDNSCTGMSVWVRQINSTVAVACVDDETGRTPTTVSVTDAAEDLTPGEARALAAALIEAAELVDRSASGDTVRP